PLAASGINLENELLISEEATVAAGGNAESTFLLNHDGRSYFVPYYAEDAHLQAIVAAIKGGSVSDIDRFLLLDNYILLQRSGISGTTELLELLEAYASEQSETVWGAITMSIAEARRLIEYDDEQDKYLDKLTRDLSVQL